MVATMTEIRCQAIPGAATYICVLQQDVNFNPIDFKTNSNSKIPFSFTRNLLLGTFHYRIVTITVNCLHKF